ncbi:hypothetical protein [Methylocapsa sp. S129]|uniref:hypothetical protein n=1 Tax=Methylocapsa sp. S129 TaxID=1641869 RepID=UPI00131BC0D1|nr:hypothetical protein [Methylocapsa sp. S129]
MEFQKFYFFPFFTCNPLKSLSQAAKKFAGLASDLNNINNLAKGPLTSFLALASPPGVLQTFRLAPRL